MNDTQSEVQQEIFKFGFKTMLYLAIPFIAVIIVTSLINSITYNL